MRCIAGMIGAYLMVFSNLYTAEAQNEEPSLPIYKHFWPKGFFVSDSALTYSIQESSLKLPNFENALLAKSIAKYEKAEADNLAIKVKLKSVLDVLNLLSENHWIALNKRSLSGATLIAKAMNRLIISNAEVLEHNEEALFSYISQIEMSGGSVSAGSSEKYLAALDLAKYVTNTPLLSIKYSFSAINDIDIRAAEPDKKTGVAKTGDKAAESDKRAQELQLATASEVNQSRTMLARQNEFIDIVFKYVCDKHPTQKEFLEKMMISEHNKYSKFLADVYENMCNDSMQKYNVVDKGQTSGTGRNTCFFNSIFCHDLKSGNIPSTKAGSLARAKNYVSHLDELYKQILEYNNYKEHLGINDMTKNIAIISADNNADAMYSFYGTLHNSISSTNDRIFPGEIDGCSIVEMAAASLGFNTVLFSSNFERPHPNSNSLLRYYSGGFFFSLYAPIIPISFTYSSKGRAAYGHARSLAKR